MLRLLRAIAPKAIISSYILLRLRGFIDEHESTQGEKLTLRRTSGLINNCAESRGTAGISDRRTSKPLGPSTKVMNCGPQGGIHFDHICRRN